MTNSKDLIEEFWALNVKVGQLQQATEFAPREVPKRPRAATPKEIAALEKKLAVTLPPSFKALLLASNGARLAHANIHVLGSTTELGGPALAAHMENWRHRTRHAQPKGTVIGWNLYTNSLLVLDTHLKPKAGGECSVRYWATSPENEHRYASFAAFLEDVVEEFRVEANELAQQADDGEGPASFADLLERAASMLTEGKNGKKAAWKSLGKDLEAVVWFMETLELGTFPDKPERKAVSAALRRLGVAMVADEVDAAFPKDDGVLDLQVGMAGCLEYIWRVLFARFDLPDDVDSWLRWGMHVAIRADQELGGRLSDDEEEEEEEEEEED